MMMRHYNSLSISSRALHLPNSCEAGTASPTVHTMKWTQRRNPNLHDSKVQVLIPPPPLCPSAPQSREKKLQGHSKPQVTLENLPEVLSLPNSLKCEFKKKKKLDSTTNSDLLWNKLQNSQATSKFQLKTWMNFSLPVPWAGPSSPLLTQAACEASLTSSSVVLI